MKTILALTLLISSAAFGATESYNVSLDLVVNGKNVGKPRMIAVPNEPATISDRDEALRDGTFVTMTASDVINDPSESEKSIRMKFVVGYVRNGQRHILSQPVVVARPGLAAVVDEKASNSHESLRLTVLANRTQSSP